MSKHVTRKREKAGGITFSSSMTRNKTLMSLNLTERQLNCCIKFYVINAYECNLFSKKVNFGIKSKRNEFK